MLATAAARQGNRPSPSGCRAVAVRAQAARPADPSRPSGARRAVPRPPSSPASGDGAPVELRGGALWWQHLHASGMQPVYGAEWSFVMQRPAVGGPGLVRVARPPKPVRSAAPAPPSPPVVWAAPGAAAGTGLALAGSHLGSCSVVIDTEYAVLRDAPPVPPNTTCTGIVWQRSGEAAELPPRRRRASSKHPRRTQWLRFTCNLCGETNEKALNPHAWREGSVFMRCEGCTAVHKLRDNLNIFHELAGPVFPPRGLRSSYLVQEILDKIQERNSN